MRFLLFTFLILSMFWQSAAGSMVEAATKPNLVNRSVMVHWQDSDHHHHADGRLHERKIDGSATHTHDDSTCAQQVLLGAATGKFLNLPDAKPTNLIKVQLVDPPLSGVIRPPQNPA